MSSIPECLEWPPSIRAMPLGWTDGWTNGWLSALSVLAAVGMKLIAAGVMRKIIWQQEANFVNNTPIMKHFTRNAKQYHPASMLVG